MILRKAKSLEAVGEGRFAIPMTRYSECVGRTPVAGIHWPEGPTQNSLG